jgi:hypothetical protein
MISPEMSEISVRTVGTFGETRRISAETVPIFGMASDNSGRTNKRADGMRWLLTAPCYAAIAGISAMTAGIYGGTAAICGGTGLICVETGAGGGRTCSAVPGDCKPEKARILKEARGGARASTPCHQVCLA